MFKIFSTYICWINKKIYYLEVSGAVRPLKLSLGVKWLNQFTQNTGQDGVSLQLRISIRMVHSQRIKVSWRTAFEVCLRFEVNAMTLLRLIHSRHISISFIFIVDSRYNLDIMSKCNIVKKEI